MTQPTPITRVYIELTQTHTLDTTYVETRSNGEQWTRHHNVDVPPLLEQLATAKPVGEEAGGRAIGSPKSRPAAWLEQLDTLILIERQAARILRATFNADDTGHALTVVRRVYAHRASLPQKSLDLAEIDAHARSWWNQARILTGHDTSAWRPNNTCPLCGIRGTLRVRITGAMCVECRETWDSQTLGVLAEHIRLENHDQEQTA